MPLTPLYQGSNYLLERSLFQSDGTTPLLVADCSAITCDLFQGTTPIVVGSYTMADGEALRPSPTDTAAVVLELTVPVLEGFAVGSLTERWTVTVPDTDFITSGNVQIDQLFLTATTVVASS